MSAIDGNGRGNLMISYLFKGKDVIEQIDEQTVLKREIAEILSAKGYKFIIADDELINEKLLKE